MRGIPQIVLRVAAARWLTCPNGAIERYRTDRREKKSGANHVSLLEWLQ
jgi:hypothetical protein